MSIRCGVFILLLVVPVGVVPASAQLGTQSGEWRFFGGDAGSTKYSPLDQIDRDNVGTLQIAWTWQSIDGRFDLDELKSANPNLQVPNDISDVRISGLKAAPLLVDDVIYISTALYQAAAINATTGETLWTYDPTSYASGIPTMMLGFSSRGLAYWTDGREHRLVWGTGDGYLVEVDTETGEPRGDFGADGRIDLMIGIPRARRAAPINYSVTSAPIIVGDVVVVGSAVSDQPGYKEMPPGHVRGFDVRTGELRWTFHNHPATRRVWSRDLGERRLGIQRERERLDPDERRHGTRLRVPAGRHRHERLLRGHRLGDNLFANSLVALDAVTGARVWHFQFVHHDLWDSDPPAAPNLVDLTIDGRRVKAVAQVTKQAFTYVFDRETGDSDLADRGARRARLGTCRASAPRPPSRSRPSRPRLIVRASPPTI